jgi:hypothetical protein
MVRNSRQVADMLGITTMRASRVADRLGIPSAGSGVPRLWQPYDVRAARLWLWLEDDGVCASHAPWHPLHATTRRRHVAASLDGAWWPGQWLLVTEQSHSVLRTAAEAAQAVQLHPSVSRLVQIPL